MEKQTKETLNALEEKRSVPAAEKKPLNKLGKQETFEFGDVEYTFQFPGVRRAQQILDASKSVGGGFVDEAYHTLLMSEIIVEPKINWDYWDDNEGYLTVMNKADTFLGGLLK